MVIRRSFRLTERIKKYLAKFSAQKNKRVGTLVSECQLLFFFFEKDTDLALFTKIHTGDLKEEGVGH